MTARMDQQLRAAFEAASEFVQPSPGLADKIRRTARRHRRRALMVTAAACVAALTATAVTVVAVSRPRPPAASYRNHGARIQLPPGDQVTQLVASGRYVYVLSGESDVLSAYDRTTGQLVRRLSVPSTDLGLATGPGGLVWLTFDPDQATGQTGIWLLSPDLRVHSVGGPGVGAGFVLPVSRTTAWVPGQDGLVRLSMPVPGAKGRGTEALEPGTGIGPPLNTAPDWAALLDGQVVVRVTNGYGFDSHLVLAGQADVTFGGGLGQQVGFVASAGGSLWAQTFALHGQYAASSGPLVRLDGRLRASTPQSILASPVLARVTDVWAAGTTVWVATAVAGHSLVCFSARTRSPAMVTLPVRGNVVTLAAAGDEIYLSTAPRYSYGSSITSYPVPAACR